MPADIFISYSRADSFRAMQVVELLESIGLSVWIDQHGIEGATSWSREIVEAINDCKALVLLLSSSSNESTNVHKEIILAAEKKKKILLLELEPVPLSEDLQYHLAGIERISLANSDQIVRALSNLGLEASELSQPKIAKGDQRKSLMILPFEDLSPTGDNGWFADGIVSELIGTLSQIKSLRLMDQQETKAFKTFKGHLPEFARVMSIRYFVQGSVRKFGGQIKITTQLLDIHTGDYLWQDSHKGMMSDIFDIQEQVAEKVVAGLKLHLSLDEKKHLAERGTTNADAYELLLKGKDYFERQTKEGFQLAVRLFTAAIELDPAYAAAYQAKAHTLAIIYSNYDRNTALLTEAESLCKEALLLKPGVYAPYGPLSLIYMYQGKRAGAEAIAKEYTQKAPENSKSHFALGFFYAHSGQPAKAIAPFEEAVRLNPDSRFAAFNLVINCQAAKETEKSKRWALAALPLFERLLKLQPDNDNIRVNYAALLVLGGRKEDAHREAKTLTKVTDGFQLHNIACTFSHLGEKAEALATFRKAIDSGFTNLRMMKEFLAEDDGGIASLAGTPDYEALKQIIENIEAQHNAKPTTV